MKQRWKGNWEDWRRRYVSGDDAVTLAWLSEQPGAPPYSSLRKRSAPSAESWEEQRANYRQGKLTLGAITPETQAVVSQAAKIIDCADMIDRHLSASRLAGDKAIASIELIDPATLKPSEALALLKFSIEAERLAVGLATQRQEIDLSALSDADLEKLARPNL